MEMQRSNPFDLLKDVDHEDPSQLIAAAKQPQNIPPVKGSQAKLPSKPLPPQQAAKEARNNEAQRAHKLAKAGSSSVVHMAQIVSSRSMVIHKWKGPGAVSPHGALCDTQMEMRKMLRISEKRSKEDNGVNLEKKENWPVDDGKADKEDPQRKQEEKQPEDKEMTLEEYEKIKEEKRKALVSTRTEGRKVEVDKYFESMKQLSVKKENDDVFIQLGSNKDAAKKKETERQEKTTKSLNVNEFLRPVEGQNYRLRRSGDANGNRGHYSGQPVSSGVGPLINDPSHFPTLTVN